MSEQERMYMEHRSIDISKDSEQAMCMGTVYRLKQWDAPYILWNNDNQVRWLESDIQQPHDNET